MGYMNEMAVAPVLRSLTLLLVSLKLRGSTMEGIPEDGSQTKANIRVI